MTICPVVLFGWMGKHDEANRWSSQFCKHTTNKVSMAITIQPGKVTLYYTIK